MPSHRPLPVPSLHPDRSALTDARPSTTAYVHTDRHTYIHTYIQLSYKGERGLCVIPSMVLVLHEQHKCLISVPTHTALYRTVRCRLFCLLTSGHTHIHIHTPAYHHTLHICSPTRSKQPQIEAEKALVGCAQEDQEGAGRRPERRGLPQACVIRQTRLGFPGPVVP